MGHPGMEGSQGAQGLRLLPYPKGKDCHAARVLGQNEFFEAAWTAGDGVRLIILKGPQSKRSFKLSSTERVGQFRIRQFLEKATTGTTEKKGTTEYFLSLPFRFGVMVFKYELF
jgi:hypothetical protein